MILTRTSSSVSLSSAAVTRRSVPATHAPEIATTRATIPTSADQSTFATVMPPSDAIATPVRVPPLRVQPRPDVPGDGKEIERQSQFHAPASRFAIAPVDAPVQGVEPFVQSVQ